MVVLKLLIKRKKKQYYVGTLEVTTLKASNLNLSLNHIMFSSCHRYSLLRIVSQKMLFMKPCLIFQHCTTNIRLGLIKQQNSRNTTDKLLIYFWGRHQRCPCSNLSTASNLAGSWTDRLMEGVFRHTCTHTHTHKCVHKVLVILCEQRCRSMHSETWAA